MVPWQIGDEVIYCSEFGEIQAIIWRIEFPANNSEGLYYWIKLLDGSNRAGCVTPSSIKPIYHIPKTTW